MSMGVSEGVSTPTPSVSSTADIASMFNEYFASMFSTKDHPDQTPTEPEPSDHTLCDVSFTMEDVSEQCSPGAEAAAVFACYSRIKHQLLLLDKGAENDSLVSEK